MTALEKQEWERQRAEGRDRFLLRSLVRFGLPFGILMVIARAVLPALEHAPVAPIWELLVYFAFSVLGYGGFMGAWTWSGREKEYNAPTEEEDEA